MKPPQNLPCSPSNQIPHAPNKGKSNEESDPEYNPNDDQLEKGKGKIRVFTKEDESIILGGIIKYSRRNNISNPSSVNLHEVLAYLKERKKLNDSFTYTQFYEKVRGLRIKFFKNLKKQCDGNEDGLYLRTQHDVEVFEISKSIWGNGKEEECDEDELWNRYPYFCEALESAPGPFSIVEIIRAIGRNKANEFEVKWMELKLKENELQIRKLIFESDMTKMALEVYSAFPEKVRKKHRK